MFRGIWSAIALIFFLLFLLFSITFVGQVQGQNSDPAGQWSTCVSQTGQRIVVEGPSCPRGWRKLY